MMTSGDSRFKILYFICMSVFAVCMYVYHIHARCPQRSEEGIDSPGSGVMDGCKISYGCWVS